MTKPRLNQIRLPAVPEEYRFALQESMVETCPKCKGKGVLEGQPDRQCFVCCGSGKTSPETSALFSMMQKIEKDQ